MKKILFSILFSTIVILTSAQVSSSTGKVYTQFSGIDYVFVFNGITANDSITYTGTASTANWFEFSESINNTTNFFPTLKNLKNATGYVLVADGKQTTVWIIDYQKYLPAITSIEPENKPSSQCSELNLLISGSVPELSYYTYGGIKLQIPREFSIKYQTLKWDEGTKGWKQKDTIVSPVILPATQQTVKSPFCNTTFTLSGDQIANDLGTSIPPVVSSLYNTNAVICHLTTSITNRKHDKNNEDKAPWDNSPINFSAPLDIEFLSNANEPVAQYYNWGIYKGTELIINRKDKDHRYTFTQAGTYKVKITASNSTACSFSDSVTVTVSESAIQVPIVFTPNGDGYNDEFRIAYRSIVSFQCWVYNRWGRQVYMWTDPTKGWDGKINGVDAKPGAYFYVIKAYGSDYDPSSKPDPKTNKRVGEWLMKGDINLLR